MLFQPSNMISDVNFEPSVTSVRGGRLSSYTAVTGPPGTSGGSPMAPGDRSPVSGTHTQSGLLNQKRFDEDVNLPLIKVVVLGAPAVGKTSVVKVS